MSKTRSFTTDLPYSRSELIHHWTSHPRTYTIYHLCSAYVCYIVNIHKWGKKNDVRSWATGDALQHFPDWPAVGGVMYVNKNAERRWPCRSAAVPHSGSASSDQLMGSTRHNAGGGSPTPTRCNHAKTLTLQYCRVCILAARRRIPNPNPPIPVLFFSDLFRSPQQQLNFVTLPQTPPLLRGTSYGLEQAFSFRPCFSPSALCEGMEGGII